MEYAEELAKFMIICLEFSPFVFGALIAAAIWERHDKKKKSRK